MFGPVVRVRRGSSDAAFLVVCEHASNRVPDVLGGLGLAPSLLKSHIAWDPGAVAVARGLAERLAAPLAEGEISRLVYDCNRSPEAADGTPAQSEIHPIPGNRNLSAEARAARVESIYAPFHARVAEEIAAHRASLRALVTVHSFTPVYFGAFREVEFGVLHGRDDRLAAAMMATAPVAARLNQPYGPADGGAGTGTCKTRLDEFRFGRASDGCDRRGGYVPGRPGTCRFRH